jgi:hypothetical protein
MADVSMADLNRGLMELLFACTRKMNVEKRTTDTDALPPVIYHLSTVILS